jgi:hypothetical protein
MKFGLETVSCTKIGRFNNYTKLCYELETLYKYVAEASIVEEEEGSVLYFVQRDEKNHSNDQVINLAKLKTLEYRVYRKLREKLFIDSASTDSRFKINQFFEEVRQLIQGYKLPMPINFYYQVAETAFDLANQNMELFSDQHNYIDFLEAVFHKMNSRSDLRSKMIKEENILTITNLKNEKQELNVNQIVELLIYAPPFITPEMVESLEKTFACKIKHELGDWKEGIRSRNLIYLINSHNFKTLMKQITFDNNNRNFSISTELNQGKKQEI